MSLTEASQLRLRLALRDELLRFAEPAFLELVSAVIDREVHERIQKYRRAHDAETEKLSNRERVWLQAAADGFNVPEAASLMGIARLTSRTYSTAVLQKLGAKNRPHAVAIGFRQQIIR